MAESSRATLLDVLFRWATERSGETAFRFLSEDQTEGAVLTFADVERHARSIAAQLRKHTAFQDRALLIFETGPTFVTSLFGCFYANLIAVPVDPPHGRRSWAALDSIAADCQPAVILTTSAIRSRWNEAITALASAASSRILLVDQWPSSARNDVGRIRPRISDPRQPAFLQYTSGSTGSQKGVIVTHRNIMAHLPKLREAMGVSSESVLVSWLPLFHDMGLIALALQPFHAGCSVTLMSPTAFVRRPSRWLQAITRYGATVTAAPDYAYRLCCEKVSREERKDLDLSTLRVALNGAERISPSTIQRFSETFAPCGFNPDAWLPAYGMAEATLMITARHRDVDPVRVEPVPPQKHLPYACPDSNMLDAVSCGRGYGDLDVRVVDPEACRALEDGQIGEVWAKGEQITAGYWNRPEESDTVFAATLVDSGAGPYLRTGDLGFLVEGELFLIGRLKEIVIIRGRNYASQDIEETVVASHVALRIGHVVAGARLRDGVEELAIAAEIERERSRALHAEEVVNAILEAVSATFAITASQIVLLRPGSIPKTSSGKLKRLECRRMLAAREWTPLHEWELPLEGPGMSSLDARASAKQDCPNLDGLDQDARVSVILGWLHRRLAVTLNCAAEEIADEEPFARLGLDSSVAAALADELADWLEIPADPTLFWEHPDPLTLVEHLSDTVQSSEAKTAAPSIR